jgi:hypothetical protein
MLLFNFVNYVLLLLCLFIFIVMYVLCIVVFVNCNLDDTRWQQYSTHLHTNSTQNNIMVQNTQNITYITIRMHKHNNKKNIIYTIKQKHTKYTTLPSILGSAGRALSLRVIPWKLPYN